MPMTPILDGHACPTMTANKAVCIGRNYAAHAAELNNPIPAEPLLFIKPDSALMAFTDVLPVDSRFPVHYEVELTVLIGRTLRQTTSEDLVNAIAGVGLGLDLTRRELQTKLKEKGHPWEKAKAFDASAIITPFVSPQSLPPLNDIHFELDINGQARQRGHSRQMITPITDLLSYASSFFTLNPGDIVFTGTPPGVGPLFEGDRLDLKLGTAWHGSCEVQRQP